MKIEQISGVVGNLPNMSIDQAKIVTDIIKENRYQNLLELGFRHGVSTCYMAGALQEIGGGHITTIDRTDARQAEPNIETLLEKLDLRQFATIYYEPKSYIWRLMRLLEEDPAPRFDFCYIDGAHDWYTDGFAFFLVDRLLKPNGLILFDDLDWSYQLSPKLRNSPEVRAMPEDERTLPQVRKVYELLAKQHPDYTDFMERDNWAYARKRPTVATGERTLEREVIYEKVGLGAFLEKVARWFMLRR